MYDNRNENRSRKNDNVKIKWAKTKQKRKTRTPHTKKMTPSVIVTMTCQIWTHERQHTKPKFMNFVIIATSAH